MRIRAGVRQGPRARMRAAFETKGTYMEGFDLISTGVWSIIPPILALGLALITKEVYSSLAIGVFGG